MELSEFSNEFDVLYNSITSNQAPGLDEYEKSVFLTQGQTDVLVSYFDPRRNKVQEGYDGSQKRLIDFSNVTIASSYEDDTKFASAIFDPRSNSKSIIVPSDILMVINERLTVTRDGKDTYLVVVPLQFQEYDRLMSKPYTRPVKRLAWRIFNYSSAANKADLVVGPSDTIKKYSIRYVKRPNPIILADLDGLTIEGKGTPSECELDPILHHEILQRAVELAKAAYVGDLLSLIALGQASKTDIGQLQSR